MSTTTKETSILDDLKAQAAALAAKIAEETNKHLEGLHLKLKDAHETVEKLTAEIRSHSGQAAPVKRGRKKGSKNVKASKRPSNLAKELVSKGKPKRGAVGAAITSYLKTKGAKGAKIKDIAAHTGNKPANVTAYFYAGAGKKTCEKVGVATFALKK